MEGLVALENGVGTAILDGFRQNAVAAIIVDNDKVVIAGTGGSNKSSGVIRVYLSGRFHDSRIAVVGACTAWEDGVLVGEGVVVGDEVEGGVCSRRLR